MSVKLNSFVVAATLFASGALAAQPSGRDSVYAEAGSSMINSAQMVVGNGRSSVYATDLPAPTPTNEVRVADRVQPGRT